MQNDNQQIILDSLNDIRADLREATKTQSEQHIEVITAVTELRTQMTALIGGVQPGRVPQLEDTVSDLVAVKNRAIGWASLAATLVSGLWLWVSHLLHKTP